MTSSKVFFTYLGSTSFSEKQSNDLVDSFRKSDTAKLEKAQQIISNITNDTSDNLKYAFNALYLILSKHESVDRSLFLNKFLELLFALKPVNNKVVLLSFEVIQRCDCFCDVSDYNYEKMISFIFEYTKSKTLGYVACLLLSNYINKLTQIKLNKLIKALPESIKKANFEANPQYFIFYLNLNNDQRPKVYKPEIIMKEDNLLDAIMKYMKLYNPENALVLFDILVDNKIFIKVWKKVLKSILSDKVTANQIKYYEMAFSIISPAMFSKVDSLSLEKRVKLIRLIWDNKELIEKVCIQLSSDKFKLNEHCNKFIESLQACKDKTILNELFGIFYKYTKFVINCEMKTQKIQRLSVALIKNSDNKENLDKYCENLILMYHKSDEYSNYVLDQLNAASENSNVTKKPLYEFLMLENIKFNHCGDAADIKNKVRITLLKNLSSNILESILNEHIDNNDLLKKAIKMLPEESELKGLLKEIDLFIDEKLIVKQATQDQTKREMNDSVPEINTMFINLLSYLGLYMLSLPFADDDKILVKDLIISATEMLNDVESLEPPKKKGKTNKKITTKTDATEDWKLILIDALAILMEEDCHFMRSLVNSCFKVFISNNQCTVETLKFLYSVVFETEKDTADNSIPTEQDDEDNGSEDSSGEDVKSEDSSDEDEDEKEEAMEVDETSDSDNKTDADGDVEGLHLDSDVDLDETKEDKKMRMEIMMNMQNLSTETNKMQQDTNDNQRSMAIQIYINKCLDLYETVIQYSPNFDVKMEAIFTLLKTSTIPNSSMQIRIKNLLEKFRNKLNLPENYPNDKLCIISMELVDLIKSEKIKHAPTVKSIIHLIASFIRSRESLLSDLLCKFEGLIREYVEETSGSGRFIVSELMQQIPRFRLSWCNQIIDKIDTDKSQRRATFSLNMMKQVITDSFKQKDDENQTLSDEILFDFTGKLVRSLDKPEKLSNQYLLAILGCLNEILRAGREKFLPLITEDVQKKIIGLKSNAKEGANEGKDQNKGLSKQLKKAVNQFTSLLNLAKKNKKK